MTVFILVLFQTPAAPYAELSPGGLWNRTSFHFCAFTDIFMNPPADHYMTEVPDPRKPLSGVSAFHDDADAQL